MTNLAGTYFTSWEYEPGSYQLGPIVVIGDDNSVVIDGVTISGTIVYESWISWSSSSVNPSSGFLQFSKSPTLEAMTFVGSYGLGSNSLSGSLYGYATQPTTPLSTWNATYYCYSTVGNLNYLGELVIDAPNVTFLGQAIANPIYTGINANGTETTELAWFTSDGNASNVAISLFTPAMPGVESPLLFDGVNWSDGTNRPQGVPTSVDNLYGTTQDGDGAAVVFVIAQAVQDAVNAGINVAMTAENAAENPADAQDDDADGADDAEGDAEDDADDAVADDAEADAGEGAGADLLDAAGGDVDRSAPVEPSRGTSGLSARELLALKDQR